MRVEREKQKKQEKFYRGPRLECERWLWWLELGDGVPFAHGEDPASASIGEVKQTLTIRDDHHRLPMEESECHRWEHSRSARTSRVTGETSRAGMRRKTRIAAGGLGG